MSSSSSRSAAMRASASPGRSSHYMHDQAYYVRLFIFLFIAASIVIYAFPAQGIRSVDGEGVETVNWGRLLLWALGASVVLTGLVYLADRR